MKSGQYKMVTVFRQEGDREAAAASDKVLADKMEKIKAYNHMYEQMTQIEKDLARYMESRAAARVIGWTIAVIFGLIYLFIRLTS